MSVDQRAGDEPIGSSADRLTCSFAARQRDRDRAAQRQRQHRANKFTLRCQQSHADHAHRLEPIERPSGDLCGRLLPPADQTSSATPVCLRQRTHQRQPPVGGKKLFCLLLSVAISVSLSSRAAANRETPFEADASQQRDSAAGSPSSAGADPEARRFQQHTSCPHDHNSHKSQQQQQQHHNNQRRAGGAATDESYLEHQARTRHESEASDEQRHHSLAANEASEWRRTGGGSGDAARQAAQPRDSRTRTQTRTTGTSRPLADNERDSRGACDDCLAIPLVALVRGKQVNGFIIPPPDLQRRAGHERRPSHSAAATTTEQQRLAVRRRQHHYKTYEPIVVALEPKSDDKCPMTGPLTVCDHIGAYPTDVILDKLDSAKKRLGDAHFNLDSFFSDERDNSDDPFERPPEARPHLAANSNSNKTAPRAAANLGAILEYPADPSANIYSRPAADNQQRAERVRAQQPERNTRANKGYSSERAATSSWRQQQQLASPPLEDFVDLVERQAISLAEPSKRPDSSASRDRQVAAEQAPARQHPTGRLSAGAKCHPRGHHQRSILTSNRTLADRLSVGVAVGTGPPTEPETTPAKDRASYGGEMQSEASGGDESRESGVPSQSEESPDESFGPAPAPAQPARVRVRDQTARKTRRSRRQVGSVRAVASSGRSTPPTSARGDSSEATPASDGDGDSGDSNDNSAPTTNANPLAAPDSNDNQAEPVCRAKSIYISPRAALNDKKQWKYVVNTPERNPQIRQIIRVDICQDPFGPCSDRVSIPFGFTSECKQKYSKKKLLALDAGSGLLEVDTFFIPSCCVCQLTRTNSVPSSPRQARAGELDAATTSTTTALDPN